MWKTAPDARAATGLRELRALWAFDVPALRVAADHVNVDRGGGADRPRADRSLPVRGPH